MEARLPDNEARRLAVLREHDLLDTDPEEDFEDIVRLAAHLCGVPIAAVSLIDEHRQWFKSITGLGITETPREAAFCAHTILDPEMLIVPDAQADPRFVDNPLVTGDPTIRFYAGVPLITEDGCALGSLCVIDRTPRTLTPEQKRILTLLARQVASHLKSARRVAEQRRLLAERETLVAEREYAEAERMRLAAIVESSEDAILGATLEGILTYWNRGAERLYGYSAAEMLGRSVSVLARPGEVPPLPAAIAALKRGDTLLPTEVTRLRKDQSQVEVSLSFSSIRASAGEMVGVSCIARDITERKRAQAALAQINAEMAESEQRLRRLTEAAFEGIAISQDGILMDVSPAFSSMFGHDAPDRMPGLPAAGLVAPQSQTIVAQKIADCDEEPYEATLLRRDGSTFQAEVRGRRIQLGGRPARVTAVRDISERKAMERAVQESEARFRTAVDAMEEGLTLQSADGEILLCNESAERILGLSADQMKGRTSLDPRWRAVREDGTDFPGGEHPAMAALQTGKPQRNIVMGVHKPDDALTWVNINAVPLSQPGQDSSKGVVVTFADITERRQQAQALRESAQQLRGSEARLIEAQRVAQMGSWQYDIATGQITWSEELFRLFEMSPADGEPSVEALMARYHPEDVALHESVTAQAMRDGLPYEFDIRILRQDGSVRWAHAVGQGEHGDSGAVLRLFGTLMDIHERKLAEERFRVLFEHSSHAHLLFSEESGIIDCNTAAVSLMHCTDKSRLLGIHPALLSPEFQPDGRRSSEKGAEMCALARQNGYHRFEWQRRAADGGEYPMEVTLTPVTLEGRPVLLSVWHDLTEQKRVEQQLRDHAVVMEFQKNALERANIELELLATTDGLTGLTNHRAFQERLVVEASRSGRYGSPLSLILLDVDHFKQYNDKFGHPAGDEVLKQVGRLMQAEAREIDLAARYGGEEFVLLLPQTDLTGAVIFAERLRAAVERHPWPQRRVTASFGIASLHLAEESGMEMIARADAALYRSKAEGRNRVTYTPNPVPALSC